jgi:hypothetical protein
MATTVSKNGGAREPSPQEAVTGLVKKDEAKGMAVHTFDPNASPAEKAAVAGKGRDQVKSVKDRGLVDSTSRGKWH